MLIYAFIIMKSLCHILIIDNNSSTGMIWVPFKISKSATNRQEIVLEFHSVWKVVTLKI